jgi:CheY-like chemotaxis protein
VSLVLYVEDDPLLQLEGWSALDDAGYEVLAASSGQEACDCLVDQAGRVGTLITDVGLCGAIGGWEVADFARGMTPGVRVIYVTGADGDQFTARGVAGSLLMAKPFDWRGLLHSLAHAGPGAPEPAAPALLERE